MQLLKLSLQSSRYNSNKVIYNKSLMLTLILEFTHSSGYKNVQNDVLLVYAPFVFTKMNLNIRSNLKNWK